MRLLTLACLRPGWRLWWSAVLLLTCARQEALAQTPGEHAGALPSLRLPALPSRPHVWENGIGSGFRRGSVNRGFAIGAGFGTKSLGGRVDHDLELAAVRFGWMLGSVGGKHDWYRGNPELLGELFAGTQTSPSRRFLFGLTPVLRYNFVTGSRWVPFVNGGVGVTYTTIRSGDLSTAFEFNAQVGGGTRYFFREDTALTFQYRLFHLSNAGLEAPNNGVNTQMFYAGLDWFD
jgi:hypothetical protein